MDLPALPLRARKRVALALADFAIVAGLFYADVHPPICVGKTAKA